MKAFGEYLRRERELRGITVEEVAQSTKIGSSTLEAIEKGAIDKLPPIPFVKGFLRAYADYVGLDPNSVVLRFEAAFLDEEAFGRLKIHLPWRRIARLAGVTALACGALLAAGWLITNEDIWRRKPEGHTEEAPTPAPAPAEPKKLTPQEQIEKLKDELGLKEIERTIADPPVEVPENPRSVGESVPKSLEPDFRMPRRGPGDAGGADAGPLLDQAATSRRAGASPSRAPAKAAPAASAPSAPQRRLVLRTVAATWVQITPDQREPEERQLQPGQTWAVTGGHFVVRIGNGGAVQLSLDGRDLGAAGHPGEFVRIELPGPGSSAGPR